MTNPGRQMVPTGPIIPIPTVGADVRLCPTTLSSILLRIVPIWVDVTHVGQLD